MLARTHLAFGVLAGIMFMPFVNTGPLVLFFGFVLIGALLPDIDQEQSTISHKIPLVPRIVAFFSKHRGVFHSVFFALILSGLLYIAKPQFGIALFIGYASHLVADGFTKMGVNFLHPVAKLHLSGFVETGSVVEVLVFLIVISLIVMQIL